MRIPLLLAAVTALLPFHLASATTISFAAGVIRASDGSPVPLNSVGVLVADANKDGFATGAAMVGSTLNVGSTLGGSDNFILQVFTAVADAGGTGLVGFNGDVDTTAYAAGVPLALYWFPTLTATGVNGVTSTTGLTITSGLSSGFYRTDAVDPYSDIAFVTQAFGTSALNAFDSTSTGDPTSVATQANLTATGVPEPSSVILLVAGGFLMTGSLLRRRKTA